MTDTEKPMPCTKCGHETQPGEIHLCGREAELFKLAEGELYNDFGGNRRRFKRHLKKMKITHYDAVLHYL